MIINLFTIISLFIAVVSLVIGIFQAGVSLYLYKGWKRVKTGEERTKVEDLAYLVLLMAGVVLMVKLLSWPLFYATLNSYVEEVQGAMCVAGVTQIDAWLAKLIQIVKPVVFFAVGGWLLLNMLDRSAKTGPLMERKFLLLSLVSLLIIVDAVGEMAYMIGFKTTSSVACCTTIFDVPSRNSAMIPRSIFGEGYAGMMVPIYYISNVAVIGIIGMVLWKEMYGIASLAFIALAALINIPLTGITALEKIAPRLMELPYHHCLYCFPRNVPDGSIIIALFVIGTFSAGWALALRLAGNTPETAELLQRYIRNLLWLALASFASSLAMVTVHLAVG